MTVAMAAPDEQETVKRLGQIAGIPVSPVFALPQGGRGLHRDPLL